jgi:hypothetical protein
VDEIKIADCSTATIKIFISVHEKTRKEFAERFRNNSIAGRIICLKIFGKGRGETFYKKGFPVKKKKKKSC